MGRYAATLAILIALLGAGVRFSRPVSAQKNQPGNPEKRQEAPVAVSAEGACAAIRDFLDPVPGAMSVTSEASGEKEQKPCIPIGAQIGFVIAMVPDPVNTRLALVFDRTIESLQAAMQDSGYAYVGHYLPWSAPAGKDSEPDKSQSQRSSRHGGESQPGVLLFREADPPEIHAVGACSALYHKHLGVLLVAETPTGGVNRKAFASARALVNLARLGRPGAVECPVPVVGPNFSGSVSSLNEAIQPRENHPKFRIITGTATSESKWKWIRDKGIDFRSVVHNDTTAAKMVILHLRNEWEKTGPIAILSEDETGYGADLSKNPVTQTKGLVTAADERILNIRFPREVSRLRNAYSDNPALVAESKGKDAPPQQTLRLDLRAPSTDQDSVPTFSKGQTPLSQDAVLTAIATTLRRERIRFAIVGATDPLDTIFIVRALRTLCPDVRLVLLSAEMLFVTAATETSLDGVLTVTTYPLFLRNQHWTHFQLDGGQPRRLQFSSSLAQGTYNAARALLLQELGRVGLRHDDELLEYFAPSLSEHDVTTSKRPPLWITALSRSGFWPVSLSADPDLTDGKRDETIQEWAHGSHKEAAAADIHLFRPDRLPRIYALTFFTFSVLCTIVAIVIIGSPRIERWKASSSSALFSAQFDEAEPFGRAIYLLISVLALLATYLLLAAPLWRLHNQPPPGVLFASSYFSSFLPVVLLAGSVVSILLDIFPLRQPDLRKARLAYSRHSLHSRIFLIAAFLFAATCATVALIIWGADNYQRGFFFAYRSVDLANGVSPIAPLFILSCAVCAWGWTHNRRLLADYTRRTNLPPIGDPILMTLARAVTVSIRRPFLSWPYRVLVAGVIILAVFGSLYNYAQSFETPAFDRFYIGLLGGVVFLTSLTLFRFMASWWALRLFLEQLERHPLRLAFSAMPPESAWSPILQRGMLKHIYSLETRLRDTAMKIATVEGTICQSSDVRDFRRKVNCLLRATAKNKRPLPHQRQEISALLQKLTAKAVAYLRSSHWTAGYSDSLVLAAGKVEPGTDARLAMLANEFVGLRYLMYIRYALLQLRNLLIFVVVAFVLTLLSINSYPFQSHHIMGWVMTAVFVVIAVILVRVFVEMERDALLSRITNTTAGKVNTTGLILRLAAFGLAPALTVLSTQFPSVGRFLFSWLQPTLEALR